MACYTQWSRWLACWSVFDIIWHDQVGTQHNPSYMFKWHMHTHAIACIFSGQTLSNEHPGQGFFLLLGRTGLWLPGPLAQEISMRWTPLVFLWLGAFQHVTRSHKEVLLLSTAFGHIWAFHMTRTSQLTSDFDSPCRAWHCTHTEFSMQLTRLRNT